MYFSIKGVDLITFASLLISLKETARLKVVLVTEGRTGEFEGLMVIGL